MRTNSQDYPRELSKTQDDKGQFYFALEKSKGGDVLLLLRPSLWPLQGGYRLGIYITLPRSKGNPYHASRRCSQTLGPMALGDAPKIVRLLPHHETTLHTTDGGGF